MNVCVCFSRSICFGFFLLLAVKIQTPSYAQQPPAPPRACSVEIQTIIEGKLTTEQILPLTDIANSPVCFWEIAFNAEIVSQALQTAAKAQKSTATTQLGAPGSSSGTTSAVSKPNTLLSLASEYGGLTSSVNNQTVTMQSTLDGIPRALAQHGLKPYCWSPLVEIKDCVSSKTLDSLNRFGFGLTANTSTPSQNLNGTTVGNPQGNSQQVSLTASGNSLPTFSSAFAKVTILRAPYVMPKQPPDSQNLRVAANNIENALEQLPNYEVYKQWRSCVADRLSKPDLAKLSVTERNTIFAKYYYQIVEILFNNVPLVCSDDALTSTALPKLPIERTPSQKALAGAIQAYLVAADLYTLQLDQSMLNALASPVLAVEYDINAPQNQLTNSTFKLVYAQSFGKPKCKATNTWTLAMNAGTSIYNSTPSSSISGASLLRDVQAGAEVDYVLCTSLIPRIGSWIGDSTTALTYYFQDQTSPSILKVTPGTPLSGITIIGLPSSASQIFTQKGQINVAQLRFGFGTGKKVKFPIAVSWSNRTELIAHPTWGLQFGVMYDFSSLFTSGGN
jgi:hypothetical protein